MSIFRLRPFPLLLCIVVIGALFPLEVIAQQAPSSSNVGRDTSHQTFQDCTNCPQMVTLPDGSAIGKFDITRAEFSEFADQTNFRGKGCYQIQPNGRDWLLNENADWRSPGFPQTDRHPVVCVSWNDATSYVDWLRKKTGGRYRLPTLEESVTAALAGENTELVWGNEPATACQYANVGDVSYSKAFPTDSRKFQPCNDGYGYTSPVGSFKPNKFGLYDMSGNVWQWTNSCQKGDCSNALFRGGGWNDTDIENFRIRHSWGDRIQVRSEGLGFRVFRDASK
jgi:formylglycine-generating enzyme